MTIAWNFLRPAHWHALIAVAVVAAGLAAMTVGLPGRGPSVVVGATLVALLAAFMFATSRTALALGVVLVWVCMFDGFLRLRTGQANVTLARDVLLYAVAAGALVRHTAGGRRLSWPPLSGWVVAFAAVILVQVLHPDNESFVGAIAGLRPHLEWVPLFFLGYLTMRTTGRLRAFLALLLLVVAANGVVSLVQFNLTPEQLAKWGPGYADRIAGDTFEGAGRTFYDSGGRERTRPFGLGSDSYFPGILGVLGVAAALALISLARRPRAAVAAVVLSLGAVTCIITSQGRTGVIGGFLAFVAFLVLGALSRRTFVTFGGAAVVALIAYLALSGIGGSAESGAFDRYQTIAPGELVGTTTEYRSSTFDDFMDYLTRYPLGAGIGKTGPAAGFVKSEQTATLNAESEFTYLLVEAGIPGLLVMLAFTLRLLFLAGSRLRRVADGEARLLLAAIAAPLFALLPIWISTTPTANPPASPYLWFSAGVLAWWLAGRRRA